MAKQIMVVDDDYELRLLTSEILDNEGFSVVAVGSGVECLHKLKTVKPDLILMDVMMPGLTGIQTIKKIRNKPDMKNVRIAILSVIESNQISDDVLKELNIISYFQKPVDVKQFVAQVNAALSK